MQTSIIWFSNIERWTITSHRLFNFSASEFGLDFGLLHQDTIEVAINGAAIVYGTTLWDKAQSVSFFHFPNMGVKRHVSFVEPAIWAVFLCDDLFEDISTRFYNLFFRFILRFILFLFNFIGWTWIFDFYLRGWIYFCWQLYFCRHCFWFNFTLYDGLSWCLIDCCVSQSYLIFCTFFCRFFMLTHSTKFDALYGNHRDSLRDSHRL